MVFNHRDAKQSALVKRRDSSKDVKTHEGGLGRVGSRSDAYPNRTYATIAPRFALLNVWNRLIEVLDKKIGRTGLNLIEA